MLIFTSSSHVFPLSPKSFLPFETTHFLFSVYFLQFLQVSLFSYISIAVSFTPFSTFLLIDVSQAIQYPKNDPTRVFLYTRGFTGKLCYSVLSINISCLVIFGSIFHHTHHYSRLVLGFVSGGSFKSVRISLLLSPHHPNGLETRLRPIMVVFASSPFLEC